MLPVEKCSGCTACAGVCPKQCIEMLPDKDGFLYPSIDDSICIRCGKCERICPILNSEPNINQSLRAFAAQNKNKTCREKSSSGGVFSALAEFIIHHGGIVYGAALSEKNRIEHRAVETVESLVCLRGSKYVSSYLGNTFQQVSEQLHTGRLVLFSGTPCQVGGLLAFLGRPYENLLTVDLICHGVPSAKVWKEYISYQEKVHGASIESVNFRSKDSGWKEFSMKIYFSDGAIYREPMRKDVFLHAFLDNLCLRPSCHACAFKYKNRKSDITLADFWGIQEIIPEKDDDLGTSLVFTHTQKAMHILKSLEHQITLNETNADIAIAHNSAMVQSVTAHHFRQYFFRMLGAIPFDKLVQNCFSPSYPVRLHRKLIQKFTYDRKRN